MIEKMNKITLACHKLHENKLKNITNTYPFYISEQTKIENLNTNFVLFNSFLSEYHTENLLEELKKEKYIIAEIEKTTEAPTLLKNSKFSEPFEFFTHIYGTPNYNEIDPTPFLAFFYTFFFGIMFGDVGQGVVVVILGLIYKNTSLGKIAIRVGFSSIFFGIAFGSVFGFHIWQSFIEVNTLLIFSAFLGVFIYIFGTSLNIYNEKSIKFLKPSGVILTLKSILNFMTSSLSFIRVGAFVLSHSAIMAFVAHLPNIALISIGNIVILGIEILVVGIQALRLCLYELLGRFYKGTGTKFTTWRELT